MKEEQLFHQALDRAADQRDSFLDSACHDDADLRERVAVLIRAHANPGSFLEQPTTVANETVSERIGTQIGPYILREQIGEGGMGVVYIAEQTEPIRRKVALKIIKPGMDTKQVIARFEAERQTLALMDHPHIAKVLDAGTTGSEPQASRGASAPGSDHPATHTSNSNGRPYFVMELVKGVPITEFCDAQQLNLRQRLELFTTVCRAVQHAHQKGIIHRDLKPSNVMVELHDVKPVPKVIDFGIAKATNQQLTEQTVYTQFSQLVGTPLYMSPEQAQLSGIDVDTRSDVYSLGVLLYELLTGVTPFDRETLKQAGYDEIRRIIQEDEPPKPSTRLSTFEAASLSTIAAQRGSDPRRLSQTVKGELDWIVMRGLEKDRARRYESASAFAADIERFLADEAVEACPPSAVYRLRKFARRNRTALTTATVVALSLLVGTGVSIWQAIDANNSRKNTATALGQSQANFREANRQKAEADRQRKLADQRFNDEQQSRKEADTQRNRAQASLGKALEAVDKMLTRVGEETLKNVPMMDKVRRELLQDALELCQALLQENNEVPTVRHAVGNAYRRMGDIYGLWGDKPAAEEAFLQAIAILDTLAADFPDNPAYQSDQSRSHLELGGVYRSTGRFKQAETAFNRALTIQVKLVGTHPDVAKYQGQLAVSHNSLGALYHRRGRTDEAETAFQKALTIRKQLVRTHPEVPRYQEDLAISYYSLSGVQQRQGNFTQAIESYHNIIEIQTTLVNNHKDVARYRSAMGISHYNLSGLQRRQGNLTQAVESSQKALEFLADPGRINKLANNCSAWGNRLWHDGRTKEAVELFRLARDAYQKTIVLRPTRPDMDPAWFFVSCPDPQFRDPAEVIRLAEMGRKQTPLDPYYPLMLGLAYYRQERWQKAIAALDASLQPTSADYNGTIGLSIHQLGTLRYARFVLAMAHWQLGRQEQEMQTAEQHRQTARHYYQEAVQEMQGEPEVRRFRGADAELRRFHAEAAELLGISVPAVAQVPK